MTHELEEMFFLAVIMESVKWTWTNMGFGLGYSLYHLT